MSDYLVHLTGSSGNDRGRTAFQSILCHRYIAATGTAGGEGVGTVRKIEWLSGTQCAACLSEIPLGWLGRLADRHGHFGVGFTKAFTRSIGGAPVWYLWRETPMQAEFQVLVNRAMSRQDPEEQIWKITPFIENPGSGAGYNYEFDWEREWRVVGGMEFSPEDVQFVFAPSAEHGWVTRLLEDIEIGPKYIFDPVWDMEKLQGQLAESRL